jgi:hypothetical protein
MKTELGLLTVEDLEEKLSVYEKRYGVPSAHLDRAFRRNGRLVENQAFLDWSALYAAYRVATTGRQRKRAMC